jgi:hypothetical protein
MDANIIKQSQPITINPYAIKVIAITQSINILNKENHMVLSIQLTLFIITLICLIISLYKFFKTADDDILAISFIIFVFTITFGCATTLLSVDKLTKITHITPHITKTEQGNTIIEFHDSNNNPHTLIQAEASFYLANPLNIDVIQSQPFNTYNHPLNPIFTATIIK